MTSLIKRLEEAEGPSRELDVAIAYSVGLGTEKERAFYDEHGWEGFSKKIDAIFTLWDKHVGCCVNYSRPGRGGRRVRLREPEIVRAITGPLPMFCCASFTESIDAALTLFADDIRDWDIRCRNRYAFKATAYRPSEEFEGRGRTPAIALCIAALKARGIE